MKVTLISYTPDAESLLLFTKCTRLALVPGALEEIKAKPLAEKMVDLEYMANTIPSSWEFVDYVFLVEGVSRAYTHQQVRTRTASYAQQAMRVVNMCDFDYVYTPENLASPEALAIIDKALVAVKASYVELIVKGYSPEDARGILPTNIATNIMIKLNLRALSDLVKTRLGARSQSEYRSVIGGMLDEVLRVHPWAEKFLLSRSRDFYKEIEAFALHECAPDEGNKLLKIVHAMRSDDK